MKITSMTSNMKNTVINFAKHFKRICIHKFYVCINCFKAGIPLQGILHDLSKFSITELSESIKYYQDGKSPIEVCKENNEYSTAWQHHKGRNPHHFEYWLDYTEFRTIEPIEMPYKYVLEMVCDFIGAGIAYAGGIDKFKYDKEFLFWITKKTNMGQFIHFRTRAFMDIVLYDMAKYESNNILSRRDGILPSLYITDMIWDMLHNSNKEQCEELFNEYIKGGYNAMYDKYISLAEFTIIQESN